MKTTQSGFSLVEVAIVVFILGMVLAAVLVPLGTRQTINLTHQTERIMKDVNDALVGYAIVNGRLPCPDNTNDGREDLSGSSCSVDTGNLPWVTLNIGQYDGWGNRFRYSVDGQFASLNKFTYSTEPTLRVCPFAGCLDTQEVAKGVVAVIISHGPNGNGALNSQGNLNTAPTNADEIANTGNSPFVSTTYSDRFDDIVTWIGVPILFNLVAKANTL